MLCQVYSATCVYIWCNVCVGTSTYMWFVCTCITKGVPCCTSPHPVRFHICDPTSIKQLSCKCKEMRSGNICKHMAGLGLCFGHRQLVGWLWQAHHLCWGVHQVCGHMGGHMGGTFVQHHQTQGVLSCCAHTRGHLHVCAHVHVCCNQHPSARTVSCCGTSQHNAASRMLGDETGMRPRGAPYMCVMWCTCLYTNCNLHLHTSSHTHLCIPPHLHLHTHNSSTHLVHPIRPRHGRRAQRQQWLLGRCCMLLHHIPTTMLLLQAIPTIITTTIIHPHAALHRLLRWCAGIPNTPTTSTILGFNVDGLQQPTPPQCLWGKPLSLLVAWHTCTCSHGLTPGRRQQKHLQGALAAKVASTPQATLVASNEEGKWHPTCVAIGVGIVLRAVVLDQALQKRQQRHVCV